MILCKNLIIRTNNSPSLFSFWTFKLESVDASVLLDAAWLQAGKDEEDHDQGQGLGSLLMQLTET